MSTLTFLATNLSCTFLVFIIPSTHLIFLMLVNIKTALYFSSFYYRLVHDPSSMLIALIIDRI